MFKVGGHDVDVLFVRLSESTVAFLQLHDCDFTVVAGEHFIQFSDRSPRLTRVKLIPFYLADADAHPAKLCFFHRRFDCTPGHFESNFIVIRCIRSERCHCFVPPRNYFIEFSFAVLEPRFTSAFCDDWRNFSTNLRHCFGQCFIMAISLIPLLG